MSDRSAGGTEELEKDELANQLDFFQQDFISSFTASKNPLSKYSANPYRQYNRYNNIVPCILSFQFNQFLDDFSQTIVTLGVEPFYINASRLDHGIESCESHCCCSLIAAQAPVLSSIGHFWLMLAEQKIKCIVMLVEVDENPSSKRPKCLLYWPLSKEQPSEFPEYDLQVHLQEEIHYSQHRIIERTFLLKHGKDSLPKTVKHFQYLGWPDHSVPENANELEVLLSMTESFCHSMVVHCSAGVGRTGTYCTIQHILHKYKRTQSTDSIEQLAYETIKQFRTRRVGIVQSFEQFEFLVNFLKSRLPSTL